MDNTVAHAHTNVLRLRRLGLDTYQEPVIYMSSECAVCRSEGWTAQARVQVTRGERAIVATLNVVTGTLLEPDEASLSDVAWRMLGAKEAEDVTLSHPPPLGSLSYVRAKGTYEQLLASGAARVVTCNTIPHPSNAIDITGLVAQGVRGLGEQARGRLSAPASLTPPARGP